MNGYIAFFNGRQYVLYAASLYDAKLKAVAFFKPRKSQAHMVTVVLAESNGKPVVHTPTE